MLIGRLSVALWQYFFLLLNTRTSAFIAAKFCDEIDSLQRNCYNFFIRSTESTQTLVNFDTPNSCVTMD